MHIKSTSVAVALAVLLNATFGCRFAYAEDSNWKDLLDAGQSAYQARDLPLAEKQLSAAWDTACHFENNDPRKAATLRALAAAQAAGRNSEWAESYRNLLELDQFASPTVLFLDLRTFSHLLTANSNFAEAERMLNRLVEVAEASQLNDAMALAYTDQALFYQRTGAVDKVESLLLKALKCKQLGRPEGDPAILIGQERLADFYTSQNRLSEAEAIYSEVIAARRRGGGKDLSLSLSRDLANLAVVYQKQGKDLKADAASKDAIAQINTEFGESPELAGALVVRGRLLSEKRPDLAVIVLQKALQIRLKEAKGNDQALSATLLAIGNAYLECDNYHAAEKSLKQAFSIDEKASGRKSPSVVLDLTSLGQLYLRQGKYDLSEQFYQEALRTTRSLNGNNHPETATCMNNLAFLYSNMGRLQDAENLLTDALAIREKVYGQSHVQVAQNLVNLADVIISGDRKQEAVPMLSRALHIEEKALGGDHEHVALILRELISVLKDEPHQLADAEKYSRRLLDRDQRVTGEANLLVARDMEILAKILIGEDKLADAKPLVEKAGAIEKAEKGLIFEKDQALVPAPAKPSINDKWALVVGISSFQDANLNLRFAAKDAIDFRNFLVTKANFQADHVKLITDQDATRANIVALLGDKWLKRVVKPEDLVVLYMSSHGTQAATQAAGTNFIVPYEGNAHNIVFSGIPMQWLLAGMKNLVSSNHICVFLDVCHGGAAVNNPDNQAVGNKESKNISYSEPVDNAGGSTHGSKGLIRIHNLDAGELTLPAGQIVMAASQADQISWESKRYSNGVFTRRLIEGLSMNGKETTLDKAFAYVREQVEDEVLRDRTQLQAPVVVPKFDSNNCSSLGLTPTSPRSAVEVMEPASTSVRPVVQKKQ